MVPPTSVAPDGVHQADVGAELPHLLHHLTDLQGQLVGGRDAQALERQGGGGKMASGRTSDGTGGHLGPLVGRVHVAEHGQAEGGGLPGAGLGLGDEVLRAGSRKNGGLADDSSVLRIPEGVKADSRVSQHQGQGVLLDPRGSVEAHVVDPLQQLRFPVRQNSVEAKREKRRGGKRGGGRLTAGAPRRT